MSRQHFTLRRQRWQRVRCAVFDRDGWRCVRCGKAVRLECDHVVPLDRGGDPFDMSNLRTLCRSRHIAKTTAENRREPTSAEAAWRAFVAEMLD